MGSIPVRSTKKHRMQNCIRRFLVLFLANPSSVRQYGKAVFLPRVSRLRETANSRIYQQKQSLQFCIRCFFGSPSREFVLGSSIRQSRILAEGIPLAGNTQPFSLVECFFLCKAVALFACGRIKARSYAFFFFNTRKIIIIKETIAATQTTAIIA